jgi:excisionase family DNA binding protein
MANKGNKTVTAQAPVQLEQLLGIPEVMKVLSLSRPMVYKLIREEGLPTVTFGDCRKVVPSSLATWIKQREQSVL